MHTSGITEPQLIILAGIAFIYLFPMLHVLLSRRSHGGAKFGWFLLVVFFSWLAYIAYLIITQPAKDALDSRR